ncbi:phasin family protein [Methylosinus sp. Sm6]|uniref:phasin family protein n=1 Tax=Methylosinus sp. Sm6 TaxID=2866948 RepID=UPI001C995E68|nr:phasin family protein [Methylosinus sp. Sm6]MBY6241057.1 phasin family protein [Methylosinus sp. Sm6]
MANLNFDDFRELGKFQLEALNSATTTTTRGLKAIAAEATDYSKQSLDNSRAYFEKLLRVQKIDDVIELQSEFYRAAYGDFFARASRVGELCSNLAKEAFVTAQATSENATKAASEATSKAISGFGEQTEQFVSKAQQAATGQR